jgi:hypothetical protein
VTGRRWNRNRPGLRQTTDTSTETETADADQFVPDDEAKKIFAAHKAEAEKRQLSSSDNFDKSILTYSSAGLAVSLAFLKDFVPISKASWASLLYTSWFLFVLATSLTIVSFLISYRAQELSISDAEEYYLNGKEEYLNKSRWHNSYIGYSNSISGVAFVSALALSSLFVGLNLDVRKEAVENKGSAGQVIQIVNDTENSAMLRDPAQLSFPRKKRPAASRFLKSKLVEKLEVNENTICK